MRKLASIRKIDSIDPIVGADAIEVATVGGWKIVVKKGEFAVGDLAVYLEIDSWVPTELAPFLSKGKDPREFEGVKGERLRTIRLRGQLSQGLLLPLGVGVFDVNAVLEEGTDVSELLNIQKWERPVPAQLAGQVRGNFPALIPKTDQERVQNLATEIGVAQGSSYEVTEKLEGSSMTCYLIDGEFGVCSRNLDLKRDENNSFWATAIADDIEAKMRAATIGVGDFAIQGELIGPGIQDNIYKLSKPEFHVFDVYTIKGGEYMKPIQRRSFVEQVLGLKHVPVIDASFVINTNVEGLLAMAEGASVLNPAQEREGIVFKQVNGGMTFKAISNTYLINER
jgi:RNA ligase (TIGR02306 family)